MYKYFVMLRKKNFCFHNVYFIFYLPFWMEDKMCLNKKND